MISITKKSKVEEAGATKYIIELRKLGLSYQEIAERASEVFNTDISYSNVYGFFNENPDILQADTSQMAAIDQLNELSVKVWELISKAEQLLRKAEECDDQKEMANSIRLCNETLRTCLAITKELKEPVTHIQTDNIKNSIEIVSVIINKLPSELQSVLREQIENIYEQLKEEHNASA